MACAKSSEIPLSKRSQYGLKQYANGLKRYVNGASMASVYSRLSPSYARGYGPFSLHGLHGGWGWCPWSNNLGGGCRGDLPQLCNVGTDKVDTMTFQSVDQLQLKWCHPPSWDQWITVAEQWVKIINPCMVATARSRTRVLGSGLGRHLGGCHRMPVYNLAVSQAFSRREARAEARGRFIMALWPDGESHLSWAGLETSSRWVANGFQATSIIIAEARKAKGAGWDLLQIPDPSSSDGKRGLDPDCYNYRGNLSHCFQHLVSP